MRGQISAEMLVVLAVLIAIAVLVASQLLKTAGQATDKVEKSSEKVMEKTDSIIQGACSKKDESCFSDSDCCEGLKCSEDGKCG